MNCPRCNVNIDEHEAGGETNMCVAVVVFGRNEHDYHCPHFDEHGRMLSFCSCLDLPYYSTDISAAWEVWGKLVDDDWIVSVCWGNGRDGRKYASIQMTVDLFLKADLLNRPITQMDARALTVPLALCRAGIKSVHIAITEPK